MIGSTLGEDLKQNEKCSHCVRMFMCRNSLASCGSTVADENIAKALDQLLQYVRQADHFSGPNDQPLPGTKVLSPLFSTYFWSTMPWRCPIL
ncbi:hypothetical protein CA85_42590 [Allorhodopirellula solitaria]|uniref:Uncharacterized protein n=1 Tax=Allorhodopirellula solitaria TaxID=2527987 RepID=A0A5C5X0H0_9BACT|nr:hypothetical protein CA85_42590 [Allorhodopirellula solitaria]